ncbi:MAG: hypothetical protein VX599_04630, partial [Pseudomonadota bacterium]|nr:hypothetical protein [Pseudomonadota bacterium]
MFLELSSALIDRDRLLKFDITLLQLPDNGLKLRKRFLEAHIFDGCRFGGHFFFPDCLSFH